jgi:hypothetical protein
VEAYFFLQLLSNEKSQSKFSLFFLIGGFEAIFEKNKLGI